MYMYVGVGVGVGGPVVQSPSGDSRSLILVMLVTQ